MPWRMTMMQKPSPGRSAIITNASGFLRNTSRLAAFWNPCTPDYRFADSVEGLAHAVRSAEVALYEAVGENRCEYVPVGMCWYLEGASGKGAGILPPSGGVAVLEH